MAQLWGGRFEKSTDEEVFAFNASIQIHCSASGLLSNEKRVTANPVNIKSSTTTHQIANFLNEKFV